MGGWLTGWGARAWFLHAPILEPPVCATTLLNRLNLPETAVVDRSRIVAGGAGWLADPAQVADDPCCDALDGARIDPDQPDAGGPHAQSLEDWQMATTPTWITLVTASSFGGLITGSVTFLATVITLRNTNRVANDRWDREWDREQARWTHEDAVRSSERTQQRLAASYLEVLRMVEQAGQWIEDSIGEWRIAAEPDELVDPDRVMMPRPAITDQAIIKAHLAAFGSDNVRRLYKTWRDITDEIEDQLTELRAIDDLDDIHDGDDQLVHLTALHPKERDARQALADAIAEELGHR
jgi:hypothetical protein